MERHPFFIDFPIQELNPETFDNAINTSSNEIIGVFFWGRDCPNCEVAKALLHQERAQLATYGLKWFHVNVYEHFDLGTRFGLFGIPTFLFFKNGKKLGRISPFPGSVPFFEALRGLNEKT